MASSSEGQTLSMELPTLGAAQISLINDDEPYRIALDLVHHLYWIRERDDAHHKELISVAKESTMAKNILLALSDTPRITNVFETYMQYSIQEQESSSLRSKAQMDLEKHEAQNTLARALAEPNSLHALEKASLNAVYDVEVKHTDRVHTETVIKAGHAHIERIRIVKDLFTPSGNTAIEGFEEEMRDRIKCLEKDILIRQQLGEKEVLEYEMKWHDLTGKFEKHNLDVERIKDLHEMKADDSALNDLVRQLVAARRNNMISNAFSVEDHPANCGRVLFKNYGILAICDGVEYDLCSRSGIVDVYGSHMPVEDQTETGETCKARLWLHRGALNEDDEESMFVGYTNEFTYTERESGVLRGSLTKQIPLRDGWLKEYVLDWAGSSQQGVSSSPSSQVEDMGNGIESRTTSSQLEHLEGPTHSAPASPNLQTPHAASTEHTHDAQELATGYESHDGPSSEPKSIHSDVFRATASGQTLDSGKVTVVGEVKNGVVGRQEATRGTQSIFSAKALDGVNERDGAEKKRKHASTDLSDETQDLDNATASKKPKTTQSQEYQVVESSGRVLAFGGHLYHSDVIGGEKLYGCTERPQQLSGPRGGLWSIYSFLRRRPAIKLVYLPGSKMTLGSTLEFVERKVGPFRSYSTKIDDLDDGAWMLEKVAVQMQPNLIAKPIIEFVGSLKASAITVEKSQTRSSLTDLRSRPFHLEEGRDPSVWISGVQFKKSNRTQLAKYYKVGEAEQFRAGNDIWHIMSFVIKSSEKPDIERETNPKTVVLEEGHLYTQYRGAGRFRGEFIRCVPVNANWVLLRAASRAKIARGRGGIGA